MAIHGSGSMDMQKLLKRLKSGRPFTTVMLAIELDTTPEDVRRKLEYMEHLGIIQKVSSTSVSCNGCHPERKRHCTSCIPNADMLHMGEMWKMVK